MNIEDRNLFREITLIKNEYLVIENHVLVGKITDINYETGEIIYIMESQSLFRSAGLEYHGTLFFDVDGQSCFVSGIVYFHPPNRIIMLPLRPISADNRKESRIDTPNLPCEISWKHRLVHHTIKGFIINLCFCGAGLLTEILLHRDVLYHLKTFFPFHNQSLEFSSTFTIKQCTARKNMFFSGVLFLNMDAKSKKNITKYLTREKT